MRVLFVVTSLPGHLNPMIGVAQHLERAGHDVEFASMLEDVSARVRNAGLAAHCHVAGAWRQQSNPGRRADLTAMLRSPRLARSYYRHMSISCVPTQLATLRPIVRSRRFDVIATDPLVYAGAIVAEQEGLRWAAISTQLLALAPPDFHCPYTIYLDDLEPERARLLAAEGVTIRCTRGEMVSPWLNTNFATEALAPSGHAICVGPPIPLGRRGDEATLPWDRLRSDKPLVYVSFGSHLAPPIEVFEAVANALTPDEADIVLATGDADVPPLPPHVIAVPWAPQLALLERASVMVTHGGANSVAEALRFGVPMLVVPLGHEQPLQAHLIEQSGAGLALALEDASSTAFASALRTLLGDGSQRKRAGEIGRSYAAADGSRRTAELLEQPR